MKAKVLSLLAAAVLLTLITWYVQHHNGVRDERPVEPAPKDDLDLSNFDGLPEEYRETVRKGLAYLAKQQHKDGHWEGDDGKHPVAMTGLVGLALFMEKPRSFYGGRSKDSSLAESEHWSNIRAAADWLMTKCTDERIGLIFSEHPSETGRYMEGHGLATLFLAGVLRGETDVTREKNLTDVLTRAVKYVVKLQSSQGGWYHTSKQEGHDLDSISATVIQIQALQAAENAGIPVPLETISDAREYLKLMIEKHEATGAVSRVRTLDTASALVCVHQSNVGRGGLYAVPVRKGLHEKWFQYCKSAIPIGPDVKHHRDELMHYYYAQATYQEKFEDWSDYRTALFERLKANQRRDGSWPACNGIGVGPVYATSIWCTILLLDRGGHPSSPLVYAVT